MASKKASTTKSAAKPRGKSDPAQTDPSKGTTKGGIAGDGTGSSNKAAQAAARAQKDAIAPAPFTAEDPSRTPPLGKTNAPPSYAGYPKDLFHPVHGAKTVNDPNEEASLSPRRNWFDTPEEADAHRTDREAQAVIHNNRTVKNDAALGRADNDQHQLAKEVVRGEAGVVRNSVSATERLKDGFAEPL